MKYGLLATIVDSPTSLRAPKLMPVIRDDLSAPSRAFGYARRPRSIANTATITKISSAAGRVVRFRTPGRQEPPSRIHVQRVGGGGGWVGGGGVVGGWRPRKGATSVKEEDFVESVVAHTHDPPCFSNRGKVYWNRGSASQAVAVREASRWSICSARRRRSIMPWLPPQAVDDDTSVLPRARDGKKHRCPRLASARQRHHRARARYTIVLWRRGGGGATPTRNHPFVCGGNSSVSTKEVRPLGREDTACAASNSSWSHPSHHRGGDAWSSRPRPTGRQAHTARRLPAARSWRHCFLSLQTTTAWRDGAALQ